MNVLAPWFLLGAAAVAAPILFHLIRRSVRERISFSSLIFLRPTPPRATRRRRIEHVLLLLLRCLGLVLLALGFSRPFLPRGVAAPQSASAGRQTVLLIDTSASMRRENLWPQARALAARYIKDGAPEDRFAVMTFDQQSRPLVSFSEWSSWPLDQRAALAAARLDAVAPGWFGTHLGTALTTAAEQFTEENSQALAAARDVVLISDLQEGAKLDGLQGHDWPKGVRVVIERVDPAHPGNAGLEILDQGRVRIANSRDSAQEKFQLSWKEQTGAGTPVYLPPGQTRTFVAPPLPTNMIAGVLRLTGGTAFSDTAFFIAPETEHVTVAYFGAESGNDPNQLRYYLQRAFPETTRREVQVVSVASNAAVLSTAAFAVIPANLAADEIGVVRSWLAAGKTALLVLTNVSAAPTLAGLSDEPRPALTESIGEYGLLGDIDFSHSIFSPFADPRFSDFSRIHFWKHRVWAIPPSVPAHVLAKFDDGAPALTQISVGQGNLLVLASGWAPADSQFALSSKFVPLLQSILDWSGGAARTRSQFQTGEPMPSPIASGPALDWRKPDGSIVSVAAGTPFTATDVPGVYSATVGARVYRFAVNLPLDESRTAPLSPDDFARFGVPLQTSPEVPVVKSSELRRRVLLEELENRQKLWRWLVCGLLAVALLEIVFGGWLSRRVTTLEVTP